MNRWAKTAAAVAVFFVARDAGATDPIPTFGVCSLNIFRISEGLDDRGKARVGQRVSFKVFGYSHRPSGSWAIDYGDGTTYDSDFPHNFDQDLTLSHVYSRMGVFKATIGPGKSQPCTGTLSVSLTVIDPAAVGELTGVSLDSRSVKVGDPVGVTLIGTTSPLPFARCRVAVEFGDPALGWVEAQPPFPIRLPSKAYRNLGDFVIRARAVEGCVGQAFAKITVTPNVQMETARGGVGRFAALATLATPTPSIVANRNLLGAQVNGPAARPGFASTLKGTSGHITGLSVKATANGIVLQVGGNGECHLHIEEVINGTPVPHLDYFGGVDFSGPLPASIGRGGQKGTHTYKVMGIGTNACAGTAEGSMVVP